MTVKKNSAAATALGLIGLAILVHLWCVVLAPIKWNVRYPGGMMSMISVMLLAMGLSFAAGIWGNRRWYILAVGAVATFVYVGWFIRSPWWP